MAIALPYTFNTTAPFRGVLKFIAWLDSKMAGYAKLIPPPEVLDAELAAQIEARVRADLTASILREAGFERRVAAAIAATRKPTAAAIAKGIERLFGKEPAREWRDHIKAIVANLASKGVRR